MTHPELTKAMRVQKNQWSCGPSALRHAFLVWGKRVSWRRIARIAKITPFFEGDTEPNLKNAAYTLGFTMGHILHRDPERAKKAFKWYAKQCIPVVVCVDRDRNGPWQHWIVMCTNDARHVWIADSSRPGPALERMTWRAFMGRACAYHPGDERYDLYPIIPQ